MEAGRTATRTQDGWEASPVILGRNREGLPSTGHPGTQPQWPLRGRLLVWTGTAVPTALVTGKPALSAPALDWPDSRPEVRLVLENPATGSPPGLSAFSEQSLGAHAIRVRFLFQLNWQEGCAHVESSKDLTQHLLLRTVEARGRRCRMRF